MGTKLSHLQGAILPFSRRFGVFLLSTRVNTYFVRSLILHLLLSWKCELLHLNFVVPAFFFRQKRHIPLLGTDELFSVELNPSVGVNLCS